MLHASTQQLIRKLYELTSSGALAWTEGDGVSSRLETEGYVVEVAASPPCLRLLRADGRELEKASAEDLALTPWPSGDGTYATRVAELAGRASRIALGAEQAIATILSSLSAPAMKALQQPTASFGETASFAKPVLAQVAPEPPASPAPKRPAPDMLSYGISARSVQCVEESSTSDLQRLVLATPPHRSAASGPNIYKPWN
jgi:hypothetical protein